jgi:hypothetical protein
MAGKGDMTNAYKILVGGHQGKIRRSRLICDDIIET